MGGQEDQFEAGGACDIEIAEQALQGVEKEGSRQRSRDEQDGPGHGLMADGVADGDGQLLKLNSSVELTTSRWLSRLLLARPPAIKGGLSFPWYCPSPVDSWFFPPLLFLSPLLRALASMLTYITRKP